MAELIVRTDPEDDRWVYLADPYGRPVDHQIREVIKGRPYLANFNPDPAFPQHWRIAAAGWPSLRAWLEREGWAWEEHTGRPAAEVSLTALECASCAAPYPATAHANPDRRFCSRCGAPLRLVPPATDTTRAVLACSRCGGDVRPGRDAVCPACGTPAPPPPARPTRSLRNPAQTRPSGTNSEA